MGSPLFEGYMEHELEHYSQRYNWDCGLACVAMLLRPEQRKQLLDNFDDICAEEGFGRLTWTIDLCYLLKRFNVPHSMYTTMLGVNEAHKQHSYYRDVIDQDRSRVNRRFEEAPAAGIRLERAPLGMEAILAHLRRGPVVLLVDAGLLSCDLCKHNKLKADFRRCFGGAFSGHYIVLVGWSCCTATRGCARAGAPRPQPACSARAPRPPTGTCCSCTDNTQTPDNLYYCFKENYCLFYTVYDRVIYYLQFLQPLSNILDHYKVIKVTELHSKNSFKICIK